MRSAVATLDDDFGYDPPSSRKAARKPRAAAPGKKKKKAKGFHADRLARYGTIGISTTVALGIAVNALMFQKGRHPAPLFAKSSAPPGDAAVNPLPSAAVQSQRTGAAAAIPPLKTAAVDDGKAAGPIKARQSASVQRDADAANDDPIARLINGPKKPAAAADKIDGNTLVGVQKALSKVGFPVKANGTMSASTRKAIEAFEKDRHLPVNGEVNKRLVKVLSAESGLHIE